MSIRIKLFLPPLVLSCLFLGVLYFSSNNTSEIINTMGNEVKSSSAIINNVYLDTIKT